MKLIGAVANKTITKSVRITEKASEGLSLIKEKNINANESDVITNFLEQLQTILKRISIINSLLDPINNLTNENNIRIFSSKWKGYQVDSNGNQNLLSTLNISSTLDIQLSNNPQQGYKYWACIYTGVQKHNIQTYGFSTQQIPSPENEQNWYSNYAHFESEEDLINFAGDIILNGYIEPNNLKDENKSKISDWK